jgi:PKD repeat protein
MRTTNRVVGGALALLLVLLGTAPANASSRGTPRSPRSVVRSTQAATPVNWSAYLYGQTHSSDNTAASAITPANAAGIVHDWTWTPPAPTQTGQPAGLLASPTVVNGVVYIGANTGTFFALDEATGKVLWQRNLGYVTQLTCGPLGIVSTATVQPAPGGGRLTVYVAGGDGYLYALDAASGAVVWKSVIALPSTTVNDYYDWSSPTVANGHIYVGVSSNCDSPLVASGLKEYDQATGALQNFYQTYPGHSAQPSIWSSAAVDQSGQHVFVTTGNGPGGDSVSIVRLNASGLAKEDAWQVPSGEHGQDSDFGGSPTLFIATIGGVSTPMVGACNKNGTYYAWKQADLAGGPVWRNHIGAPDTSAGGQCDAAAIWDGAHLYVAANGTTIKGVSTPGSIQMLDPATGTASWQRGLVGPPIGSPTMDGAGVIAVTQYGRGTIAASYALNLISAATGAVLKSVTIGPDFGQPVFADDKVLVPSQNHGLQVYSAPPGPTASFTFNCTGLVCSFDGSGSTAGVTKYVWDFGDGSTNSGQTTSHTYATAGTYTVTLTVTGSTGQTGSQTRQVTVPPSAAQIAFIAAVNTNANAPTEHVTIPASVTAGDALILIASGALNQPISAPAGWALVGTNNSNGVMVTSVWSRVATAADAGSTVTVTFSTTYRKGGVHLLAYSGTSTTAPVQVFATNAGHVTTTKATTPTVSVTNGGSWVVSGWETKSSTVTSMTAPAGQVVRDTVLGSGTGRLDMLATDYGGPVKAAGTAGGLTVSTDQAFTADTTLTLVLAPAS